MKFRSISKRICPLNNHFEIILQQYIFVWLNSWLVCDWIFLLLQTVGLEINLLFLNWINIGPMLIIYCIQTCRLLAKLAGAYADLIFARV